MNKMSRRRFTQTAMTGAAVVAAVAPTAPAAPEAAINGVNLPEHARLCIVTDKVCIIWEWTGGRFVEQFRGEGISPEIVFDPNTLLQK